ncbi:MAG TPA: cellulose binding domain-containing protein, partial [Polyangiaceae bacterium]
GSCAPAKVCANGRSCAINADCSSGKCTGLVCQVPTCADGVKNQGESAVDCGGSSSCARCGTGLACTTAGDCLSGVCTGGFCAGATCTDLTQNGTETDQDCGGTTCDGQGKTCANGKICAANADCQSGKCTTAICQVPACNDGVKNQGESGVDCGGSTSCARCGTGLSCTAGSDCVSSVCTTGACAAATCTDATKNGTETAVDCGGATCVAAGKLCANGLACVANTDCASGKCTSLVCQVPSCTDGVKNNGESDIDCGGSNCAKCAATKACTLASDCVTGVCTGNVCQAAMCNDGVKNGTETDTDCGGSCAPGNRCANGKVCTVANDCTSAICTSGLCVAPPPTGLKLQIYQGDLPGAGAPTDNGSKPYMRIVNTSTSPVAMAGLTIRYWVTLNQAPPMLDPGAVGEQYSCDFATTPPGCGIWSASFVPVSPIRSLADTYLLLTYVGTTDTIPANNGSMVIQARWNTNGFLVLDERNDYSYSAIPPSTYTDWSKITLYQNGSLIWGTEPSALVLNDNFEDGDSAGWTTSGGTWTVPTDGTKVFQGGAGSFMATNGTSTWTDQTLDARMKVLTYGTGTTTAFRAGISTRETSSSNQYFFGLDATGNWVVLNGTATISTCPAVASGLTGAGLLNTWFWLRMQVTGSGAATHVTTWVNSTQIQSCTINAAHDAGGVALVTTGAAVNANFDDVHVTTP